MKNVQANWLSISVFLTLSSTQAFADAESRIINGEEAKEGDWPFIAALVSRNINAYDGQFCGASFIGEQYVLTAAHCVNERGREDLDVVIGVSDLSKPDALLHRYAVDNIYVHESYDPNQVSNDIAIIELTKKPSESVVNLVDSYTLGNLNEGEMLTVMGWGDQDPSFTTFLSRSELYQVQVPLVNHLECQSLEGYSSIGDDAFCAGYKEGGYDSCQGDSGGPIVVSSNGNHEQLGIVSWGNGCAQADAYGVYTNIGHFDDWIKKQTAGFSYRAKASLDFKPVGLTSHTFEFSNKSEQNITINNVSPIDGLTTTITHNSCKTLLPGQQCEVSVSYDVDSIGLHTFGVNVSTDSLVGTVTSEAQILGVRTVTSTEKSLIDIPNSGVYSTEQWLLDNRAISSPYVGDSQFTAFLVDGIPSGTVSFDLTVSSEDGFDFARVSINGQEFIDLTGEDSELVTAPLVRDENNSLLVIYVKDSSGSQGNDKVTIKNFMYTNEIKTSRSNISDVAKSSEGSGGSLSLGWLLALLGLSIARASLLVRSKSDS